MDLERMLEMCRAHQWKIADLDWTRRPRIMDREDEMAIVQYFTDMAEIERLAGALFREQRTRVTDPTLRAIFATFVADEERHATAAERLASFYDVHHHRAYAPSETLVAFRPHFLRAITYLSDDVASAYVTGGELILDIALLRSINDFVHDDMSEEAMRLINRDESRHIAIDYRMVEYYASDEYTETLESRPSPPIARRLRAWWTFANVIYRAKPFFQDVFFQPMERVDPSGKRLREAIRRFQLLGNKPGVAHRPFGKFMLAIQNLYHQPLVGPLFGRVLSRIAGVDERFLERLNSDDELERARHTSYEQMADEALAAKLG
jgi:hypothetical protein